MKLMTPALPLHFMFNGIQCSTAHITDQDNERFYQLSHDQTEYSDAEWIHFTGTGYLLRLSTAIPSAQAETTWPVESMSPIDPDVIPSVLDHHHLLRCSW